MVYLEKFEDFAQGAEELFRSDPTRTRYVLKYRHVDGKLDLKVTNDKVVLKYKTQYKADIAKVDAFNSLFLKLSTEKDVGAGSSSSSSSSSANANVPLSSSPKSGGGTPTKTRKGRRKG